MQKKTTNDQDIASFGDLLTSFRRHRHLTQQQLAVALNMRRSAVIRWEQGDFLPASKTIVLELARALRLDDQETRRLLEASLTALPPHWLVPFQRNPFFTGREEILETLHKQLGTDQEVSLIQSLALHGLGGVGKTQIALEYAYRHALEYSAVFWIEAETIESIILSFLRIAEVLQLPGRDDPHQQRMLAAVQRWLTTHTHWLLIWDNLEAMDLLSRFLPPARQGAVLITTRCQVLGPLARGIDLEPMHQEEGLVLLLRRAKVVDPEATTEQVQVLARQMPALYTAATHLVTEMGRLPLAIDQAAAYIEETGCSLTGYMQRYHQKRQQMLARRGTSRDHPHSVVATLRLSCQRVGQQHPAALELLRFCAFLYPDAIPEELLLTGADQLGSLLGAVVADAVRLDLAIATLRLFSLVQRHPDTRTLSFHRLVQVIQQEEMGVHEQEQWHQRVIHLLNSAYPATTDGTGTATWERCGRLLPHVMACAATLPDHLRNQDLADVLLKAADYLHTRSQNDLAESLYRRALQVQEQVCGSQHPHVGTVLDKLAYCYRTMGAYEQAEPLFQAAVRVFEQALGPQHPRVASPLEGLAIVYREQGKYEQAEPLYQRALCILEQALGPEHAEVATSLNKLGILYREQGKYEQAEWVYQRALCILEQVWGPEHPLVARPLNNLGNLYREQGKYEQAERLCLRAVRLSEQALGPKHTDVAFMLDTLAELYTEWGKYEQAEPLYQRCLRLFEQALGPEHPKVTYPLNGLAILSQQRGDVEQAERLFQRTLQIREQHLGMDHPETAQTLHDLARFRQMQGRIREARALAERALAIRVVSLGNVHPKAGATRALHAQLIQAQEKAERGALPQFRAVEIPDSPVQAPTLERTPSFPQPSHAPSSQNDPVQAFLDACCLLHPHAWCRISELWQSYEHWAAHTGERLPLSRRAFAAQIKAHGCHTDRTNTARIWRGITLEKAKAETMCNDT